MKRRMDARQFKIALEKIALKFFSDNQRALKQKSAGIVGIHTRGALLAKRIAKFLKKNLGVSVLVGSLDITLYRDDVGEIGNQPLVKETEIPFSVEGKTILLVDDVLYTGRTIRAALDSLLELGRPKLIRLAVMADRSGRELPIQADYVGTKIDAGVNHEIQLRMKELDGEDGAWVTAKK